MPNTREKLIELICDAKYDVDSICIERDWCDGCPAECGDDTCKEAYIADHLIAKGVTVQEWISVKDRLPEAQERVLTVDDSGYVAVNCISIRFGGWFSDAFGEKRITHWMPLPQPPKGE